MVVISDFYLFLASVVVISMSGVLLPGPLFAVTIEKSARNKTAGILIALGHGVVEFPLMFLIFFVLAEFEVPWFIQDAIGLVGGLLMIYLGYETFKNRNKPERCVSSKGDSLLSGIRTTAANPGFILWWLTVGTTLILNAKLFGLVGFSVFAGVHWSCDFVWYSLVAFLIFKSYKFWTFRVHQGITFFCVAVLSIFGAIFFGSAFLQILGAI